MAQRIKNHLFVAAGSLLLTGCVTSPLSSEDMASEDAYESSEAGPVAMRRLTKAQFNNALLDLFGNEIVVPEVAEPDVVSSGLPSVGASESTYSSRGVESGRCCLFRSCAGHG